MICADDYPQLALLLWNRKLRTLSEEEALALYEAHPQWVEPAAMDERERTLFERLLREHGEGVWNG